MFAKPPQEDLQKVHKKQKNRESFLETLESVVVAFVLAFVFRAFVVEAFVIPTGSMGPTLYGAHYELKCTDCGYAFAVGRDGEAETLARREPDAGPVRFDPVCPNCFLAQTGAVHPEAGPVTTDRSALGRTGGSTPGSPYGGDRILVLKFIYDFEEPKRWDVIVFHNPSNERENYIKRLVGLPGEKIQVVRGDVEINGLVTAKTDFAQDQLWQVVHDTRYRPMRQDWVPRWAPDKAWTPHDTGFAMDAAPAGGAEAWLTYRHRDGQERLANIKDFCAYDATAINPIVGRYGINTVTDLSLRAEVTAASADSVVDVVMRAWSDTFRFELTTVGSSNPSVIRWNGREVARAAGGVLPVGRAATVQAINVDHQLELFVNGKRVMVPSGLSAPGDVAYDPTEVTVEEWHAMEAGPTEEDPNAGASEVRLGARGGAVSVAWLRLDRDVYYTDESYGPGGRNSSVGSRAVNTPFAIGADEFFPLGDNSPMSSDARFWSAQHPDVPRKNLVGKAFFVYWPAAGYRYGIPSVAPDLTGFRLVH
jgi:signal peptidase I